MNNTTTQLSQAISHTVQYVIDGEIVFGGILEYIEGDWAGIRQVDGRLDEAPTHLVEIDPT